MTKPHKGRFAIDAKLKHGSVTDYYVGGELCSVGAYAAEKKHGEFKFFLDSGVLQAAGRY